MGFIDAWNRKKENMLYRKAFREIHAREKQDWIDISTAIYEHEAYITVGALELIAKISTSSLQPDKCFELIKNVISHYEHIKNSSSIIY